MKIFLFGYGKMGRTIERLGSSFGYEIVGFCSKNCPLDTQALRNSDVAIDFSSADSVMSHIEEVLDFQKPIVIGTTGWEKDLELAKKKIEEKKGAALFSPNFSIGVSAFVEILKKARELLPHYEIGAIEVHHSHKKDSPSGTAKKIENELKMETPFLSLRFGQSVGRHELIFDSPYDTLTLSHEAKSREGFAKGALEAAKWILNQKGWFTSDEFFRSLYGAHHPV